MRSIYKNKLNQNKITTEETGLLLSTTVIQTNNAILGEIPARQHFPALQLGARRMYELNDFGW